jgi:hypothetical protein
MQGAKTILVLVGALYIGIGFLHSIAFSFMISRNDCIASTNFVVGVFCDTGVGISHFVAMILWPFYWV